MRKFLSSITVSCIMASLLVGCGGGDIQTSSSTPSVEEASTEQSAVPKESSLPYRDKLGVGYYNYDEFKELTGDELTYKQSPVLDEKDLPPVEERLPENPLVYQPIESIGNYGGKLTYPEINIDQDWNLRHLNSGYFFELNPAPGVDSSNSPLELESRPGIFESWSHDEKGHWFEFTIRKGLKWSDGTPVTTEDIRFCIEDVFLNKEIYPVAPTWLNWGGGEVKLNIVDDNTFRIEFGESYGGFALKEVTVWNSYFGRLMVPSHYMKEYHKDYATEDEIKKDMEQYGFYNMDEWGKYYSDKKMRIYSVDYIGMPNGEAYPTLDPWMVVKDLGNGNYLYERNPYYHMVDTEGNQLPYIDQLQRTYVSDSEVMNMEIISGKVDMASANLFIENYPLYVENADKGNYNVLALPAYQDHDLVYSFNYAAKDEMKKKVFNDLRFRQAISMSFDREAMNETMYLGLGTPSQAAPRPTSLYFEEGMDQAYIEYNPEKSKQLLDEMGLKDINNDGFREDLEGKPFTINCDWFEVSGSSASGAEYAKRYFEDIGIRLNLKQIDPSYYWGSLQPNNDQEMTIWWLSGAGADTIEGWFTGVMVTTPLWFNYEQYLKSGLPQEEWPSGKWEEPSDWGKEIIDCRIGMHKTASTEERIEYARKLWKVQEEQLHTIGIANNIKMPFVISKNIENVTPYEELEVPSITVLEQAEGWYFKE